MEEKMGKKAEEKIEANPGGTLKVAKKPYISPQLIEYGNVEKLTRNGGLTGADAMLMQSCL